MNIVILKFPSKARPVSFYEKTQHIYSIFHWFFRKRIRTFCCFFRYFWILILSIPEFLICYVLWSKVTVTLKISSGLRPMMSWTWKKLLWYQTVCYHNVSLANKNKISSFYAFSFRTTSIVYIGKQCESSTMTHRYCIHTHWKKSHVIKVFP